MDAGAPLIDQRQHPAHSWGQEGQWHPRVQNWRVSVWGCVVWMTFRKPKQNRHLFDKMHMCFSLSPPAGDGVGVSQSWSKKIIIHDLSLLHLVLLLFFPPGNTSSGRSPNTLIYWHFEFGRFVLIWGLLHKYGRSKMNDRCCPQNLWLQKHAIPVEIKWYSRNTVI